jgi:hypothetical protein
MKLFLALVLLKLDLNLDALQSCKFFCEGMVEE